MRLSGKNNLIIPTIQVQPFRSIRREQVSDRYLGVTGYLGIFVCSMGLVTLATPEQLPWIGILSLLTTLFVYPKILRRFVSWNRVLLLGLMIIPPLFLFGEVDQIILGIGYSRQGGEMAIQILLRFIIVMLAVDGLTESVEITSLAGLFERFGFKGLGFSFGVALNMLPALRETCANTWHCL